MTTARQRRRVVRRALRRRRRAPSTLHPGFRVIARRIARRQGISEARARAIVAAGARNASSAARARNPRLRRVRG